MNLREYLALIVEQGEEEEIGDIVSADDIWILFRSVSLTEIYDDTSEKDATDAVKSKTVDTKLDNDPTTQEILDWLDNQISDDKFKKTLEINITFSVGKDRDSVDENNIYTLNIEAATDENNKIIASNAKIDTDKIKLGNNIQKIHNDIKEWVADNVKL